MSLPRSAVPAAATTEASDAADPHAGRSRLVPWRRSPFPAPWSGWFGREAPLHLEIGFGDGRYTVRRAARCPEDDFVGIEASGVSVRRALAKLRREDLSNVRLVKAGAQIAVRQLFAPGSLRTVTVNFPDPWPKERHAGHRLLRGPFLTMLAGRLEAAGEIRLATDHPEYLAQSIEQVEQTGWYEVESREPPLDVFETKYARKWRDQGKPLHYVVFVRNDRPVPDRPPIERPDRMPHALIHGRPAPTEPFAKQVFAYGEGHVILHELLESHGGDRGAARWLVRATIDEPDLTQQVLIVVQWREGDEWIVRLESFGDPIVTPAVRGAVHAVTDWLETTAGVEVRARNY